MKFINFHLRSIIAAISRIFKSPIEHLLNIIIIAVLVSVLCIAMMIHKNIDVWKSTNMSFPKMTIYLKDNFAQTSVSDIKSTIDRYDNKLVKNYQFISKNQGLTDIQKDEQLKAAQLDTINEENNPLPDVLIVEVQAVEKKVLAELADLIGKLPMVDSVDIDLDYTSKIESLINFAKKAAFGWQVIFIIILILTFFNMVRLQMLLQHSEITVLRLVGASGSFIMRPLSYYILIQVIFSGFLSYSLIKWFTGIINNLFVNFENLFGSEFILQDISGEQFIVIMLSLGVFSLLSVFLAVQWVFKNVEAQ